MAAPTPPAGATALLVLGMHRSGTSALAGALARLGVELGPRLIEAAPDNPLGYWEHAGVVEVHERLLHALCSSWEDPRELPAGWLEAPETREAERELEAIVSADFAQAKLWALKDPRLCRFLPLWLPLLARLGVQAKVLAIVREPAQVARSLAARDHIKPAHAELLWLRAASEIAEGSAGLARTLLDFEQLMADPERGLAHAAQQLQLQWPQAGDHVREAVSLAQRHQRRDGKAKGDAAGLHARLGAAEDPWAVLAEAGGLVARAIVPARDWLDSLVPAIARARAQHADVLARLAHTDESLGRSAELSHERMLQLESMDAQLRQTQSALQSAEALSRQHLQQMRSLDAQLSHTQSALAEAEALAGQRLGELADSEARLAKTQSALAAAEALSLQRMDEVAKLDAGLADAQRQCAEQLAQLSAIAAQLDDTETQTRAVITEQLAQLARTEEALAEAQALSLERLAQMQALDARLGEMDAALAHAQSLVAERTSERDAALARRR